MSQLTADATYNIRPRKKFPMNLTGASKELGITIQRLSRYIRILQVPVERHGHAVMMDRFGFDRVRGALVRKEVKRGRKKKAS